MSADPIRWLWAGLALVAWLLLTGAVVASVRRARRQEAARAAALRGDAGTVATLVAYASQTGQAEDLAWMTARVLSDAGEAVQVVSFADIDLPMLGSARRALLVVSTTGEGDPPDSAARMLRTVLGTEARLPDLEFAVLALGDRSYCDFCGFGIAVHGWLSRSGARPLFDMVQVDDADPAAIRHWQHQLAQITGATAAADWSPPAYDRWRLVERIHLNPGSPGGEAFHLAFEPVGILPGWSAGDIAEIGVPVADDPEGGILVGSREYSIASLPADGRIELLVRRMHHPDGTPGLASGWLTGLCGSGGDVPLRIRTNRAFHGPPVSTPLILIGAGTGLAGLRAHLKTRNGDTWLMFGERTSAHDAFHDAELATALATGVLTRLDRAFSRDPGDGRYVQALISEHHREVVAWVERGATIMVCGSLQGMAPGVHAALETVLGPDVLIGLAETGRYRRDVY